MIERQELWCHECQRYVQFDIDTSMNGNHIIKCPNCGHEHCRVVTNGRITETRWDRRNNNGGYTPMQVFMTTAVTSSASSTFTAYSSNNVNNAGTNAACAPFMYTAWMNTNTGSGFC